MNELSKFLVESILNEDENPIKKTVVIYVGRFQPFHKGHYGTYSHLVKKFGKDNVFIGTSDKVEKPKSPFNFKEKVKIMTTMFGIPSNKIHKVKNPYQPTEILSKFDEETTAFITVVGEKDKNRLGGKYFTPYKGEPTEGYRDRGYVYAAPSSGGGVSGTEVRNGLSIGSDEQKEEFFKGRAYGKFNKTIFKMITDKLNEGIIEIPKERIEEWLINESSYLSANGLDVDDGPNFFFPNYDVFSRVNIKRAAKIGWEVVNMITTKELEDYYDHPSYPAGPVKAVSYFPAGVLGAQTPANQVDIYSSGAYTQWFKHATRSASLVGYDLVMTKIAKDQLKKDKEESGEMAKGDKVSQEEYEASLNEAITLPIEIGDTILTGRFKNKKVVVKSIGKDEHGMPTINGKKVVTFRLMKEGFQAIFEDEGSSDEDKKYKGIGGQPPTFVKAGEYEKWQSNPDGYTGQRFKKTDSGSYVEVDKDGNEKSQDTSKRGSSVNPNTTAGQDYINRQADGDPAKKQQSKKEPKSKVTTLQGKKSGKKIQTLGLDGGGKVYGTEHGKTAMVDDILDDVKKNIPKERWKDIVFVGEGGSTNDNGELQFHDEMDYAVPKFKELGAGIDTWDGDEMDVHNDQSKLYKRQMEKTGLNQSQVNAGNWASMIGQGEGTDTMSPDDFLDDEGKEFIQTAAKEAGLPPIENWENPTGEIPSDEKGWKGSGDKGTLYRLAFPKDNKDKQTKIGDIQDAFNETRDEHLIKKSKELSSQGKIPIVIAGESHVGLVDKMMTNESVWPKSKLTTQHEKNFDDHLNYRLSKKFKGKFNVVGFDLFLNGKKLLTIDKRDTYNSVLRKVMGKLKESLNEIAGTEVKCEKCNHSWEIESEDTEKYLCHSCGWDSQKQEYDFDAFDSWQEKMGLNEDIEEARRGGKLRPAALVRRKFALAGKGPEIARARKRTMMRRKPLSKLKKIAYKMAYRQVYDEFAKELFPDIKKSDLSVLQSKIVHKNVLRKKKRVLKRARFKFLPDLRAKEAEKFSGETNEMSKSTLNKIEKYAEKQLSPEDIEFTKHFFDRVNDPRNGKEISDAELTGFFKRLSRYKKQFKDFLEKYQQIVVKDKRTDINIPFVKQANQIIAKTVMRKDDFKTSNPTLAFEQLAKGMSLRDIAEKHDVSFEELSKEAKKGVKVEMEHTSDVKVAYNIAKDHLFEDPKYYTKLATIEELAPHGYPDQEWMDNHDKEMKKLRKQLDKQQKDVYGEGILTEGGAYGHMNHPFDTEINLTFGDLKDIVSRALEGNLELTREKTDGQALAISWRDGRLVAARNKGHLKNRGENALDIKGVADKFAGRGELEKAYNFAMNDLSKAIKSLSEKQREKIFKGGACFMNLEVIYPTSVNVIPYGQALLVFHGTMEYDESGVAIGENQEAARILAGMIKQVNKDVQDNYTIQGPPVIQLPKNQNLASQKGKFTAQISKLQKEFGLKDTDGVAEYHQAWWSNWIDKNSPSTLDNKTKMGLVKRFAFFDKSFRLDNKNITDEKVLEWAKKHEKDNHQKIAKQNLMKFENIFLGLGAEVLQFTSSVLTVNPDKAVRDIKKRIDKTIKDVKKSGDPKKIEKLKLELQRLNSIGGPDKIVPNEGIVFQYKGNTFKLTGTFASVNQLLGIFF